MPDAVHQPQALSPSLVPSTRAPNHDVAGPHPLMMHAGISLSAEDGEEDGQTNRYDYLQHQPRYLMGGIYQIIFYKCD